MTHICPYCHSHPSYPSYPALPPSLPPSPQRMPALEFRVDDMVEGVRNVSPLLAGLKEGGREGGREGQREQAGRG